MSPSQVTPDNITHTRRIFILGWISGPNRCGLYGSEHTGGELPFYTSRHLAVSVLEDEAQPARTLVAPPSNCSILRPRCVLAFLARALRRLTDSESLANIALLTPDAATAALLRRADGL